jgi:hypothetical protein
VAGDWIKMRSDLFTHPKVVRMSSALQADRLRTVGGLMSAWCLFDAHSIDGRLDGYTLETLDELVGWRGFSRAMESVGWLVSDGGEGLSLPAFDTHNGASAKRRAMEADRKRAEREAAKAGSEDDRNPSALDADKKRTRGEERREEIDTGADALTPGFQRFWETWPKSDRKAARGKCFASWKKAKADALSDAIVADVERLKHSTGWTKNGGEFIPAPLVYLNERRWEGANDDGSGEPARGFV